MPQDLRFKGLTVYFPFYQKMIYPEWLEVYKTIPFSQGYQSFITDFGRFLTGDQAEAWSQMNTSIDVHRDNRIHHI